ncbi:MAG: carboxypeptidase regulatory-like domain-containing protein [Euryarchaeota archaeon]|nr:carboxypeptidase regulatory-like domain-containing protein [Euryarchaeota archaeon]
MADGTRAGTAREEKAPAWRTALWLLLIFALALFLRSYFNFDASVNDGEFLWSGTDGYYHERVVEHIQETGEFLQLDKMINYPVGAVNPRPPFFVWTIAAIGGLLAPLFGGSVATSTGYALAFAPAVWGAATVFPLYFLGKSAFGRRAGLWAAGFLAITAAHMQRSNFGALDHDGTILFFFVLGAMFFVRALRSMDTEAVYVDDYRRGGVGSGYSRFFRENRLAVIYSLLTGASFAGMALTWKGYPYAFAVFAVWFGLQLIANHLRGRDSSGIFVIGVLPFLVALLMIWPYYAAVGRLESAVYPLIYILVGVVVVSVIFVPTRHLPPILVLPVTLGAFILGILLLMFVFTEVGDLFFTGLGYFVQSKLYSTIAEAQRTDLGFLVFSVGVVPFFFAFAGMFFALASFIRNKRDDHLFILAWAGVGLFMAFTASRFVFNATTAIALLAGWVMVRFIDWIRFGEVSKTWRSVRSAGTGFVKSSRQAVSFRHVAAAVFIAFLVLLPNFWLAVDAGIPQEYRQEKIQGADEGDDFWQLRTGAFGQDFLSSHWIAAMAYLRAQDRDIEDPAERPAFMAWWDYGFYAAQRGAHPTVADPFQFGYQISGRAIASQSEEEAINWFSIRLLEAERIRGSQDGAAFSLVAERGGQDASDRLWNALGSRDYNTAYDVLSSVLTPTGASQPDDESVVSFYRDLRQATGHDIRYFTLDGRMFPCDDPRTQSFIDASSIFYAPVFLADKNPDDFVKTTYTDASGTQYTQRIYESTADNGSRQIDQPYVQDALKNRYVLGGSAIYPMGPEGNIDYGDPRSADGIPIARTALTYEDVFYNSLLYRAWIGPQPQAAGIPLPLADQFAPGYGLKHFRLVHSTTRVDMNAQVLCGPLSNVGYDKGVQILKYYDGAIVTGSVVDHNGEAVAGAEVEVRDNFGIPHDSGTTGADGTFRLIAPFSTDLTETHEAAKAEHTGPGHRYTGVGPNQLAVTVGGETLAVQEFSVSDEEAMTGAEITLSEPLRLTPGDLAGFIFQDRNANQTYEPAEDRALGNATVALEGQTPVATGPDGSFRFNSLVPGAYNVTVTREGFEDVLLQVGVRSETTTTRNISMTERPITVSGTLEHDGTGVSGLDIVFLPVGDEGTQQIASSGENGTWSQPLPPGEYNLTVSHEKEEDGRLYRYFTAEPVRFDVQRGQDDIDVGVIELQREEVEVEQGPQP